jgi:thiamine biosynthesis protein ThiS
MIIQLNHTEESFEQDQLTIKELLQIKNFTYKALVIKINGQVVRKNEYESSRVHDGDRVEVIHLISGG